MKQQPRRRKPAPADRPQAHRCRHPDIPCLMCRRASEVVIVHHRTGERRWYCQQHNPCSWPHGGGAHHQESAQ